MNDFGTEPDDTRGLNGTPRRALDEAWPTFLEALPEAALVIDPVPAHVVHANGAAEALLGYGIGELRGIAPARLRAEGPSLCQNLVGRTIETGSGQLEHLLLRRADGETVTCSAKATRVGAGPSPVVLARLTILDEGGVGREAGEGEYRTLFEGSSDGIFITSRDGRLLEGNPAGLALLGLTRDDLDRGVDASTLYADADGRRRFQKAIESTQNGRVQEFEMRLRGAGGAILTVRLSATVRHGPSGEVIGYQGIMRDITARTQAERALRSIFASTVSRGGAGLFRPIVKHLAQALGVRWALVARLVPEERAQVMALWSDDGFGENFEYSLADTPCEQVAGEHSCCHWSNVRDAFPNDKLLAEMGVESYIGAPLLDATGTAIGLIIAMHDDTLEAPHIARDTLAVFGASAASELNRLQGEATLHRRDAEHSLYFESVSDIIFVIEPDGVLRSISPSVRQILGYDPDELVGRHFLAAGVLAPASVEPASDFFRAILDTGTASGLHVYEFRTKDGSTVVGEVHSSLIVRDGELDAIVSVARDITARVQTEETLRQAEQWNRYTYEQAAVGIVNTDPASGRILRANARACEILGRPEGELQNLTWMDVMHTEDAAESREKLAQLLADPRAAFSAEKRYVRPDGRSAWCRITASVVCDGQGAAKMLVAVIEDIEDQRRDKTKLTRLATAMDQAGEEVVITDTEGVIEYVNPAFERGTGFDSTQVLGETSRTVRWGPDDPEARQQMLQTLEAGATWTGQVQVRSRAGSMLDRDMTVSLIRSGKGEALGYVSIRRDLTKRLELESQLRQAQKLEAIGTLAGGIAHDFNNVLAPIIGYTEMTLEDLEVGSRLHRYQTSVAKAARRASDLVRKILTFSRRGEQERRSVNLGALATETIELLRATLPSTIEIRCDLDAERSCVHADPTQMQQVLMNLATNAGYAMQHSGGLLELRVEPTDVDAAFHELHPALHEGPHVRLTVHDTGAGMDMHTLARAFEPFFTTKPTEEGTGLGLSVVHGIVSSHGGLVTAESTKGTGTTFVVYLPRVLGACIDASEEEGPLRGGTERILLVDDEESIAQMATHALRRMGYRTQAVTQPHVAIETFRDAPDAFDLVITDLTMPRVTGIEVAEAVAALRPGTPVLIMTGYAETKEIGEHPAVAGVIPKPSSPRKLARAVRNALDAR